VHGWIKYQVRLDNTLSEVFIVETGLKHADVLSPQLFKLILEKIVKIIQSEASQ